MDSILNVDHKDDYVLGRSLQSRIRLNQQHFMYHKIFGYLLHPQIPRSQGLKVADVATGTGIWMLDVMSELPASTSYHGFDIDLSQTPPQEWLPHNMSFSELDLHGELPQELEGRFDIINIRLLVLVVRDNNPTQILHKMLRMLKPGGWLQWTEADNTTGYLDFVKAKPQLTGCSMRALRNGLAFDDPRLRPTWPLRLPAFFRDSGFEHICQDQKLSSDFLPWLAFTTDVTTAMYQERVEKLPPGDVRDDFQQLYNQAAQESREGVAWNGPRINVVGQKPKG